MNIKNINWILSLFFLGCNFLLASTQIKEDETVTFFPTYGYCKGENVIVDIHGWIYELEEDSIIRNLFYKTLFSEEQLKNPFFKKRVRYFLADNERKKKITIEIAEQKVTLPPSKPNGHFQTQLILKNAKKYIQNNVLEYHATGTNFRGKVQIVSPNGIGVISDIDDTIKISNVTNKKELFKNTFSRKFKPVLGMPSIYQKWKNQGADFFYVSGSPWQLYPQFKKFIKNHNYPEGSFHLKYFRVKDSSILKFIKSDQLKYKTKILEDIVGTFPNKKYILVGDSGEMDAAVYAGIAKKYPERVVYICIRDVKKEGDTIDVYTKIFEGISQPWVLFEDAAVLNKIKYGNPLLDKPIIDKGEK